jgi:hypothetical protein
MFITVLSRARHPSLLGARLIQSAPSYPISLKSISDISRSCYMSHRRILFNVTDCVFVVAEHFVIHICQYCVNPVPYFVHIIIDLKLNLL